MTEGWAGFELLCRAGPRPPTTVLTRHPSPPLSCHWRLRVLLNKSTPAQRPVAQAGRADEGEEARTSREACEGPGGRRERDQTPCRTTDLLGAVLACCTIFAAACDARWGREEAGGEGGRPWPFHLAPSRSCFFLTPPPRIPSRPSEWASPAAGWQATPTLHGMLNWGRHSAPTTHTPSHPGPPPPNTR
jgi:hypothetical protein